MPNNLHKVFISYYHKDAQSYKDALIFSNDACQMFIDGSVDTGDIDDRFMTDEQIRIKIRDEYIKDADVMILLCGRNSKHRKHIDWELHAAMYKSSIKEPIPILVFNLPDCSNQCRKNNDREKEIIENGRCLNWVTLTTYSEFKRYYPDLPERLLKSLANKYCPVTIVDWNTLTIERIRDLVEFSYQRRFLYEYDDSDPLRRRDGEDEL